MARGIVLAHTGQLSEVARKLVCQARDQHKVQHAHPAAVPYKGRDVAITERGFTREEISQMDEYSQNFIEQDFIDFLRTVNR